MMDRLALDLDRIQAITDSLRSIAAQDDPVGQVLTEWEQPSGLNIRRVRTPLGVVGVISVHGPFGRGDSIALLTPQGHPIGYGLTRYTSAEAEIIKGHQTSDIEALLGSPGRAALIHRDDLALS